VGILGLAALINYLDRATLSVALPQISAELFLGPTAKGLVLSAFFGSYALMQVSGGLLVDRWNLGWLYAGAFGLWSVACGMTGAVGGLATLILARIFFGVGESIYLPSSLKLVSVLFPSRDRGLPTGLSDSGTRLGLALGAPLAAWLTVRYGWRTMFFLVGFLRNHREAIAAMDFFAAPTISFGVLHCFFVIGHGRRRILHFNVTRHPTSSWIIQQLREAFPFESVSRFLIFDRDAKYELEVPMAVRCLKMTQVRTSFESPWQKDYASYCTSLVRFEGFSKTRGLFESLTPGIFRGGFVPGCSYKHSFLSL
jgi:MFS family permease